MREWLIVIISILILGVLIDGIRRMLKNRRNSLRMRRLKDDENYTDLDELTSSEFPSGGARVAVVRDEDSSIDLNQNVRESYTASRQTRGAPVYRSDVDEGFDEAFEDDIASEPVDVLNEPETFEPETSTKNEPEQSSLDLGITAEEDEQQAPMDLQTTVPMLMESVIDRHGDSEPTLGDFNALEDTMDDVAVDELVNEKTKLKAEVKRKKPAPVKPKPKPEQKNKPTESKTVVAPDKVLVIHMMARQGEHFSGGDLLEALLAEGLRFGDMDIFHRHETDDGDGPILFSLANGIMPGTFDLQNMDDFSTPGVSLFLSLPIEGDCIAAYDLMALTAHNLTQALGGELKDENRSVMTRQTVEHGRQSVIEYERKRRLSKGQRG